MRFSSFFLCVAVALAATLMVGCPPDGGLTVSPASREVGPASGTTTFTISNAGQSTFEWSAEVTQGVDWLSVEVVDAQSILVTYQSNAGNDSRQGEITVTAPGAVGSPATVTVTQLGASAQGETDLVGDWGGYWWYTGTEGNVYITWTFDDQGNWSTTIPSAGFEAGGTYVVGEPNTIDIYIDNSNTAAFVVGQTLRGYYSIDGDVMYRSQLFQTRLTWSTSLLDPEAATVFVADRL